jgi:hypothetical protein
MNFNHNAIDDKLDEIIERTRADNPKWRAVMNMFMAENPDLINPDLIRRFIEDVVKQRTKARLQSDKRKRDQQGRWSNPMPRPEGFHRPPGWVSPVQEFKNQFRVSRLIEEQQAREKEAKRRRQLTKQLIDSGYKSMATRLHPDHGGSTEDMVLLSKVRDLAHNILKGI